MSTTQKAFGSFLKSESGAALPFIVLALVGALVAVSFALDTTRMVNTSSQVKRATDAAALAIGQIQLRNENDEETDLDAIAQGYVLNNLGMDSGLIDQVQESSITVTQGSIDDHPTYTVSVTLNVQSDLLGAQAEDQIISSTVEVVSIPTEVALMLPNTLLENDSELSALRTAGKNFARNLFGEDSDDAERAQRVWLSLVPYSQAVNVFDENDPDRISRWASPGALNPPELRSLFRTGQVRSMADPRFPDRVANLLCMYRGLGAGENFFWNQSPTNQFGVYYRNDLPENGSPGADPITWVGPHPDLWPSVLVEGPRWIVADIGCPSAALLPLTNDLDAIDARLDEMTARFNVNYAIAMGWAGQALSPGMRGNAGWGDTELPLDFSKDKSNLKVIVMLAKTTGDWFDTDSYNFNPNQFTGSTGTNAAKSFAAQRFHDICRSFKNRNIKFFFIGVRPGDPKEFGRTLFANIAGPGLRECTNGDGGLYFADASNFTEGRGQISDSLEEIAEEIRQNYYVRLIK
ncbi:TadE/TadG family type IV pilus assembly protein [Marinomonas sp. TW1]|uniref:TadE/TadG family type IV pilus assembly protein n=1 Tax=Marinomonas sp. TW1 TaxID=1561203 RepID=UPI001E3E3648|nr:TadE/TadG family type IV pilus assembly protein [Marinomonas sp. TW1]